MINLAAFQKLRASLIAGSQEQMDPAAFAYSVAALAAQAAEGIAIGGSRRGNILAPFVGEDFATAKREMLKQNVSLTQQELAAPWSAEFWILHQAALPFLSLAGNNATAYTVGNKIVGFSASPVIGPLRQSQK